MNRLREVIDQTLVESRLPQVDADLCLHSLSASSSCTACVDACHLQAWVLDDSQLGLDSSSCDGCGLCVPVCPEAAIKPLHQPLIFNWKERDLALIACDRAGVDEEEGVIPCIHSLGVRELLLMYRQGIMDVMVTMGVCSLCNRGNCHSLDKSVSEVNQILHSHGLPSMAYHLTTPERWVYNKNTAMAPPRGPDMGRRSFLQRAMGMMVRNRPLESRLDFDRDIWTMPPGRLIPAESEDGMVPFVPVILENSCHGCDVCTRVCPHGAITVETAEQDLADYYQINAHDCTGCNLCVDACDIKAVSIHRWEVQTQYLVPLTNGRCQACGVDYHFPAWGFRHENGLCRVCSVVNHSKKLYQVLD